MIDTHCHINDELYRDNPAAYIDEAKREGVEKFLVVGFDLPSSQCAVEIAEKFPCCYAAVGVHPSEINNLELTDLDQLKQLAQSKKVIAVGEIGLDFYYEKDENIREKQRIFFKKQIEIANELNLPVSIHCRDANEECLKILKENRINKKGIMHCYSGSSEMMNEFTNLGLLLGIGGVVTFKNAQKLKDVVSKVDSKFFVLETDAPYLTPEPYRGQKNHSKYLCYVRKQIATLRQTSEEDIENQTTENFKRVFNI